VFFTIQRNTDFEVLFRRVDEKPDCGDHGCQCLLFGRDIAEIRVLVATSILNFTGCAIFESCLSNLIFMMPLGKGSFGRPVVRVLLVLSFWGIWLALPFLMLDDDDIRHRELFFRILPASATSVVLFFILAAWIGPRMLRQQKIKAFLFAALGLSVIFLLFQGLFKTWLLAPDHKGVAFHTFRSLVHVFLAAALGTGYALVRHTLGEEKSKQEVQQERLKSELAFLRSQISPHFIFNVLNSIVYLIRSKSEQAENVTLQLSALMRYMLYENGDSHVALEKEVGYLKNYVELQKIRFEEDVEIRLSIQGDIGVQSIEPMLLIPFVENAFKHGVGLVQNPIIDIALVVEPTVMHFSVRNKITSDSRENKDQNSGIGLQNIRRRLELLYPKQHWLSISETDGYFEIKLSLQFN
jgi:two-component system LytT family sensor kinase